MILFFFLSLTYDSSVLFTENVYLYYNYLRLLKGGTGSMIRIHTIYLIE